VMNEMYQANAPTVILDYMEQYPEVECPWADASFLLQHPLLLLQ
jgi:hypothetical protein